MADKLKSFVEKSLSAGATKEKIKGVLIDAGWPLNQINDALNAYASVEFSVPVPRPKIEVSAREAFMYLVMFSMLYLSVYHLIQLIILLIDLGFPDALTDRQEHYITRKMRWSASSVVVAFPVFLFMSNLVSKSINKNPIYRTSSIRIWLTFLTLSLAACVVVGSLIYLVNGFLSGDITVRFILKVIAVGTISGSVFWYYLRMMRADDAELSK